MYIETSNDRVGKTLDRPDEQKLTARVSNAGSVRRELEELLKTASSDANQETYCQFVIEQNAVGKRTEASRKQTWPNLRGRHLLDPDYLEFRTFRDALDSTVSEDDRALVSYLMMARTDRLFREVSLEQVSPNLGSWDPRSHRRASNNPFRIS